MATETEIKLKISDLPAFHRATERLGACPAVLGISRVHEENVIFDTAMSSLYKQGQLLRIRTESPERGANAPDTAAKPRVILTFKQPVKEELGRDGEGGSDGIHKVREEIEVEVSDAGNLARIFEGLSMKGWFRYEKYRTTFCLPDSAAWGKGLLIELDETPIGTFVELEGPSEAIDRAAAELGFSESDYILQSYLGLYLEDCRRKGEEPRHMLF